MADKTGSTYISESMTDNIKIPTANLIFRPRQARTECPWTIPIMTDNRKWPPKPEIHISETVTDNNEIPTKSGVYDHVQLEKVSTSDCNRDRQSKVATFILFIYLL